MIFGGSFGVRYERTVLHPARHAYRDDGDVGGVRSRIRFCPGARRELFEALFTGAQGRMYDVSPNGERFLMLRDGANLSEDVPQPQIIVVENWFEELKERVPVP